MACCAFVAFLVSQAYLMAQGLTRWVFRKREVRAPSAVMWRLDSPVLAAEATPQPVTSAHAPPAPAPRRGGRAWGVIPLVVAVELTLMVGGVQWIRGGGAQTLMIDAARLASARSFADLKIICTTKR
jgi:hypothetical protein